MIRTLAKQHKRSIMPRRQRVGWYGSVQWQRLGDAWLQRYPVCVLCLARGEINRGAIEEVIA